ncbi:MAG: hypothetical protein IIB99_10945 [Planctomycetes bacterium]|nr:hypothetical protein [Planctomycetota bacterium]
MPELPEVERGRRLVERVAVGRTIVKVRCARDSIVFEDAGPARMRKALLGRRVLAARRRGKHIWFELDKRPWPTFHFGMTGAFHTPGTKQLKLASSSLRTDDTWPPRFVKIHLWFDDAGELGMPHEAADIGLQCAQTEQDERQEDQRLRGDAAPLRRIVDGPGFGCGPTHDDQCD